MFSYEKTPNKRQSMKDTMNTQQNKVLSSVGTSQIINFQDFDSTAEFKSIIFNKKDKQDLDKVKRELIEVVSQEMQMLSENMSHSTREVVVEQVSKQFSVILNKLQ